MEQNRPQFVTTETAPTLPILIIDKKGYLGKAFADSVKNQLLIVLATAQAIQHEEHVIHIPFKRKIPRLPDNTYSHIFVFYNGESEVLDMLSSLVKKAHDTKAKVIFCLPLEFSTEKLYKQLQSHAHPALQLIIYGEIFDNSLREVNDLTTMIHHIRTHGRITVPNEGMGLLYPVHIDDVLLGIATVAFRGERQFKTYYLFPHHPFTLFSVSRMFQLLNPDIKIDYKKKNEKRLHYYIPHGVVLLQNYRLEDRLRQIDITLPKNFDKTAAKKIAFVRPNPTLGQERIKLGFLLFFSIFIAPLLLTIGLALTGGGFLAQSVKSLETSELAAAYNEAKVANVALSASKIFSQSLVLPGIFFPSQRTQFATTVQTGLDVVSAEIELLEAGQRLEGIYAGKSLDPKNDFLQTLATLKNTLLTLQKLQAEGKLPKSVAERLQQQNGTLQLVEGTVDTWPVLFGFEGKKTYLVLFQNNMELRPGGGFIGSYGIVSFENGKMSKLQINDVYDADGQLKTHIEPPFGLRRYLGAEHWYLRDSNFALDFRENALQASQFLNLETGQQVDGIIALDTTVLKNLLAVVGEIKVSEYNETVTADNFYLLTQTYAEKDFFPGSSQKKDFLRSLSNTLLQELMEKRNYSYENLLTQIDKSTREKHLMIAFADNGVQNTFTANGISSALQDNRSEEGNVFLDFLSVVDANVGANKANYYVKRSLRHDVTITSAGSLQARVEATYANTSTAKSNFGGDYKNFVRFIIPATSQLQRVFIDGRAQSVVPAVTDSALYSQVYFVPPTGLEVEESFMHGKKVIGFFIQVPVGKTKHVAIEYATPRIIKTEQTAFSYMLRLFKQPGMGEEPYSLTVSYPEGFGYIRGSNGISDLGAKFVYETSFVSDKDLTATMSKK